MPALSIQLHGRPLLALHSWKGFARVVARQLTWYIKQELARILRTFPLKTPQRFRIGEALVAALQKGKREDLKEYARLARYVDTPRLRARLAALTSGIDTGTAWRAKYVLDRCEMNDYRKDERSAR